METTMNQSALDGAKGEIVMYQPDETIRLGVRMEDETVWLTQQQMVEMFLTTKQNVSLHVSNIFKEKELEIESVVKESLTTATDGKRYKTNYYNLDVIISVGFRNNTKRGIEFRQWATAIGHRQPQCPVPSCQSGAIQQSPRSFPAD